MMSKAKQQSRDTKIIAAISANFASGQQFTFNGVDYKAKDVQALLQSRIDAAAATATARSKWLTASGAEAKVTTEVESVLLALKSYLVATHGADSAIVSDFGFTPKTKQTTADAVALAVKKRAATREARGTMGKKAKLKIKGVVTPETGSAAPTEPAAPSAQPAVNVAPAKSPTTN